MGSLKEKAKTLAEWDRLFRNYWTNGQEMLLKLEDAQKEIDELKQKLQRWFEDLGRWIFSQREDWEHPKLPQNLKERFMELLKEEKEAK